MSRKRPTVSEALRRAIVESGQTAMDIERATGVSNAIVSRFQRGERGLNSTTIDVLAKHFGLELTRRKGRPK